jgi:hypothetical protein
MRLSVIVTIVDGGLALNRCLEALRDQTDPPEMEVLVPYDDTVSLQDVSSPQPTRITFLPLGTLRTAHGSTTALGQHELFDRRRAAGLWAATGDLIAMLEDRGVPRRDWAAQVMKVHSQLPHAVIGGAIDNGVDRLMNWAVYYCDFGRYQPPFAARASSFASDVNVSYKRAALESVKPTWAVRYHEPSVHNALRHASHTVFLTPDLVVDQMRGRLRLGALWRERVGWARLYAEIRQRDMPGPMRLLRFAAAPLLPFVLLGRMLRDRLERPATLRSFVAAVPLIIVLLSAWSLGEAIGYASNRDDPARRA